MTKIQYFNANGNVVEKEIEGSLLEALEFVQELGVKGAQVNTGGSVWIDVDSFMIEGRKMFAPRVEPKVEPIMKKLTITMIGDVLTINNIQAEIAKLTYSYGWLEVDYTTCDLLQNNMLARLKNGLFL